jgi:hypothetical protein
MPKVVETAIATVTLSCGIDQRQPLRLVIGEKTPLERDCHALGEADADETTRGDRVAAFDQPHEVIDRHHLVAMHERICA